MKIVAENLGKRYNAEWIFRGLHLNFESGQSYAITGANGSGKSTLLQVISGIMPGSEGTITYFKNDALIEPETIYKCLSIATPYQELIEEFTLVEMVDFHIGFNPFINHISREDFITRIQLESSSKKELRNFSSGMKQRLKIGLAVYTDTPILLLDEPTTNLDKKGIDWYTQLMSEEIKNKLVVICSNQPYEYDFCQETIHLNS